MGFWEYVQSAMDGLKWRSPEAASVKDACRASYDHAATAAGTICAAAAAGGEKARTLLQSASADAARLGSSSVAPVKDAYRHAWNYTSWAAGEADRAVRVEAPRCIAGWMPEAEKRQMMLQVLKEVGISAADIAITEGARCVPGGPPMYRVIKKGAAEIARIQREVAEGPPSEGCHLDGGAGASPAKGGLLPAQAVADGGGASGRGDAAAGGCDRGVLAEGIQGAGFLGRTARPRAEAEGGGWGFPEGTSGSAKNSKL